MDQKLDCNIIKDLLPLYIDNMTSQTSNQCIDEHLKSCQECKKVYEQMEQTITVETAPELHEFKKFLNKIKIKYIIIVLLTIGIIAIGTCFIVNIALEKRLSWSLIATSGIIFAYLTGYVFLMSKKNKILKGLLCISLYIIPFLWVIQFSLYNIMGKGTVWIWSIGIPITVLWLGILWIGMFFNILFKLNIFYCISIITFLSIPGNAVTNIIVSHNNGWQDFIINGFANTVAAIIFLIIAIKVHKKAKS
jgi:hypothetical protein